jgi:prolyl 4-hydroxylase
MGSMLQPHEPFSVPQLVRYFPSQKYDLHTDYWPTHQLTKDHPPRRFNRPASFFVFLRSNCTGGYTYFPEVNVLDKDAEAGGHLESMWDGKAERGEKNGEKKGIRFKPIAGNAIFWINLDADGKGDKRLVHAGEPVEDGEKIGMNLWPRKYFGYED